MFDPQMELLLTVLTSAVAPTPTQVADSATPAATWADIHAAAGACGDIDDELEMAIELEDADELRSIITEWYDGKRHLPEHDRAVLKRALKAYRKTLKITVLDAESSLGGGPMSGGRSADIVAITPPPRYKWPVWDELVRQGRLRGGTDGMYELPPGG